MRIYIVLYLIGISLFQLWQYRTWKSAQREKQVFAWLRFGRMYLPVFFLPIVCTLPSSPIFLLLKSFYVLFFLLAAALDIWLHSLYAKSCRTFLLALRPDSEIIIQERPGTDKPWNPYYKFSNFFLVLVSSALLKWPLVVQQENYLIVHDILAFAFREEIASHPIYFQLHPDRVPAFLRRKTEFWKREAKLYLICSGKDITEKDKNLPFPADKTRWLDENDILQFPHCLIRIIEDAGIREKMETALSPYKIYQGTDPGKAYLAQMISQSLGKRHSATEYFYELMKLAEFMIHYRSLADYEKAARNYFDSGDPVAMGTFQDGIVDADPCEPQEKEAYIQALKYLNKLCTGKEGSVNRRKLMAEGRQKLVMVRNHFIGHGSLSYGISTDFVEQLLTVTAGQIADFFHLPDPVIKQLHIRDIPKICEKEGRLYLLVQLEAGVADYYLDHSSGKFLTQMK